MSKAITVTFLGQVEVAHERNLLQLNQDLQTSQVVGSFVGPQAHEVLNENSIAQLLRYKSSFGCCMDLPSGEAIQFHFSH